MQRRDFLKLTAAASFTAAAAACNAASAASSGPASEALPGSTPAASETKASEGEATLTTNEGDTISLASLEHCTQEETAPTVYFTREISAEALVQAYQALGWAPAGKVAVKLSTGEPPASNDPVALDQACIDLVYAAPDHQALTDRIESRHGIHTLESAEAIGLGSRTYRLEVLDV